MRRKVSNVSQSSQISATSLNNIMASRYFAEPDADRSTVATPPAMPLAEMLGAVGPAEVDMPEDLSKGACGSEEVAGPREVPRPMPYKLPTLVNMPSATDVSFPVLSAPSGLSPRSHHSDPSVANTTSLRSMLQVTSDAVNGQSSIRSMLQGSAASTETRRFLESEVFRPAGLTINLPEEAAKDVPEEVSKSPSWLDTVKSKDKPHSLTEPKRTVGKTFKRALNGVWFRGLSVVALFVALFGSAFSIIFNLPDDPWINVMDTVMMLVLVFFVAEQVMRSVAEVKTYPLSFFFFMDLIGTASMVFEISFLLGSAGTQQDADSGINPVLMRTARAAKLGARAARLSKILKCVSIMYGGKEEETGSRSEAKNLNARLMLVLSTKVSMLTVILVLGMPIFNIWRYPDEDLSMRSWCSRLEADYAISYDLLATAGPNATGPTVPPAFHRTAQDLVSFYQDLTYHPFSIEGYPEELTIDSTQTRIPGESIVRAEAPNRKENVLRQVLSDCALPRGACENGNKPSIYFDFTTSNQFGACMDIGVILFMIACMVWESYDLSRTLNVMVVKPVEMMLDTVHEMANILSEVTMFQKGAEGDDDDDDDDDTAAFATTEVELLDKVFKRLAKLTSVFLEAGPEIDDGMDDESKAVVLELMQQQEGGRDRPKERSGHYRRNTKNNSAMPLPDVVMTDLAIDKDAIESWDLDILRMEEGERQKVLLYIFFDSNVGSRTGRAWADLDTFQRFHDVVRAGYNDHPYHNFMHACDVVASCNRLLQQVQWEQWLSSVDAFALLVASICHDIGHPGKTSPFLIETNDALALRYNDKSPLENMHCARLFEILSDSETNVFSRFGREEYKQARTTCITAILNTDNAVHFDMVKDIKKAYEVAAHVCDLQAQRPETFVDQYLDDVLCKNTTLWIKLLMHLADIANPMKPFAVYKLWASRVVDEFFSQGDEEKQLGIPIGMLNDRDKVSRPGAEHGFINFLVAPLLTSAVRIFPVLLPLADQMARNLEVWRNIWVQEAGPSAEDVRKRDADVQKIREQVEQLHPVDIKRPAPESSGNVIGRTISTTSATHSPSANIGGANRRKGLNLFNK